MTSEFVPDPRDVPGAQIPYKPINAGTQMASSLVSSLKRISDAMDFPEPGIKYADGKPRAVVRCDDLADVIDELNRLALLTAK